MVAITRTSARAQISESDQDRFLVMMPLIRQLARRAFANEQREERDELVQAAIAVAYSLFARLVEQGKSDRAFASPLARFAVRRVKDGRQLGGRMNRHDVMSRYARRFHGLYVERLDDPDTTTGGWKAALIEDRRCGPADIAAARVDVGDWLRSLPSRQLRIAVVLSSGETTSEAARRFNLSEARVSQFRRELSQSWERFQTPTVPACRAQ